MRQAHDVATDPRGRVGAHGALPDGALMERAAAGLAATCASLLDRVYGSRVALLVGSGDNGGDALFAGALLARRGAVVTAVLLGSTRARRWARCTSRCWRSRRRHRRARDRRPRSRRHRRHRCELAACALRR